MIEFLTQLLRRPAVGWWDLLDIALVSILIYELLLLIRGTRAAQMAFSAVFESANGVYGVGHNSFTVSPDGKQDWIVYHAKLGTAPGWGDRVIRMQPFRWRRDGTPDFGAPVPSGTPLPCP